MSILSVSGLNNYISFKLKNDIKLKGIMVEGEISNYTCHYKSGHMYFTLKDSVSTIKTVMFASNAARLRFVPREGMRVVVAGNIDVYMRDGVYQINATDMYPSGTGELYLKYEKLKQELSDEGLFDDKHKKQIPQFPDRIGIVTSSSAAALADIINILTRRYPLGNIMVYPCAVQGEKASEQICKSLYNADNDNNDVIIVTRGGGSFEDLFSFSSEEVARTVSECVTPVISAVGHETDFSLCDFASDMRAPTPSAAAELVAPDISQIYEYVYSYSQKIKSVALNRLAYLDMELKSRKDRITALFPITRITEKEKELNVTFDRLNKAFNIRTDKLDSKLCEKIGLLESLSPLNVLSRGYSIAYKEKMLIDSIDKLDKGDSIDIRLRDGTVSAFIKELVKNNEI